MRNNIKIGLIGIILIVLMFYTISLGSEPASTEIPLPNPAGKPINPPSSLAKLPISFVENRGQMDSQVKFYISGPMGTVFFTPNEMVTEIVKREKIGNSSKSPIDKKLENLDQPSEVREKRLVLRKKYLSSNPKCIITGGEALPGKINILRGNDPSKWKQNISTYKDIRYQNIYPGVDLIFRSVEGSLKYDYIVVPGKKWNPIKFSLQGADILSLTKEGDLAIQTPFGTFHEKKPYAYQEVAGKKIDIPSSFTLTRKNQVGLKIGKYNRRLPLVIDPLTDVLNQIGIR